MSSIFSCHSISWLATRFRIKFINPFQIDEESINFFKLVKIGLHKNERERNLIFRIFKYVRACVSEHVHHCAWPKKKFALLVFLLASICSFHLDFDAFGNWLIYMNIWDCQRQEGIFALAYLKNGWVWLKTCHSSITLTPYSTNMHSHTHTGIIWRSIWQILLDVAPSCFLNFNYSMKMSQFIFLSNLEVEQQNGNLNMLIAWTNEIIVLIKFKHEVCPIWWHLIALNSFLCLEMWPFVFFMNWIFYWSSFITFNLVWKKKRNDFQCDIIYWRSQKQNNGRTRTHIISYFRST